MKKILVYLLALLALTTGCKKGENPGQQANNGITPPTGATPVVLPDSVILVSNLYGGGSGIGTTIQLINAATGYLVTAYNYPIDPKAVWCLPFFGNGFLYDVENDKINALNINTGAVLWTDSVKNFAALPSPAPLVSSPTILHSNTFYGLYAINTFSGAYVLCAVDATKQSNAPLWKYSFTVNDYAPSVTYYNGVIYLLTASTGLTALDAGTGSLKWTISNSSPYSLASLNNGFITAGNTIIDAASGNQVTTVSLAVISPAFVQQTASSGFATTNMLFVLTQKENPAITHLSAINPGNGALKWTVALDSTAIADISYTEYIQQLWNNELIIQSWSATNFTGAGSIYGYGYSAIDINSGQQIWNYEAGPQASYMIVNNILYTYGNNPGSGAYGEIGANIPPALSATDLSAGKQKWTNSKLIGTSFCMLSAGKAYSPYIQ